MVKVSVIIPIYNVEEYLYECLSSVITQTYKNLEIICVNDGSTDGSADILQEYIKKDKRIKVINQENLGLGIARNNGVKQVTGEYLMFLDADDYFMPDTVEKMLSAIESEPEIDCVICNIKQDKKVLKFQIKRDEVKKINSSSVFESNCHIWNKIYKTSIIKEYNLEHPKIRCYYEDNIFTFKYLISCNKIKYIKDELYYYRMDNPTSLLAEGKMEFNQQVPLPQLVETLDIYDYIITNNLQKFMDCYFEFFVQTIFYWYPMMSEDNCKIMPDFVQNCLKKYDLKLFSVKNQKTIKKCIKDKYYLVNFITNYTDKNKTFCFIHDFNRFYLKFFNMKFKSNMYMQ